MNPIYNSVCQNQYRPIYLDKYDKVFLDRNLHLSSKGSRVRIPLKLPRRDLGQVLHSQLPVGAFGVKLRHSIRAVSGAPLSSSGLEEAL